MRRLKKIASSLLVVACLFFAAACSSPATGQRRAYYGFSAIIGIVDLGMVAAGKNADFIVLDANPSKTSPTPAKSTKFTFVDRRSAAPP